MVHDAHLQQEGAHPHRRYFPQGVLTAVALVARGEESLGVLGARPEEVVLGEVPRLEEGQAGDPLLEADLEVILQEVAQQVGLLRAAGQEEGLRLEAGVRGVPFAAGVPGGPRQGEAREAPCQGEAREAPYQGEVQGEAAQPSEEVLEG